MEGRITYRYLVYDILTMLHENYPDTEFTIVQVVYWLRVVADRIIAESMQQYKFPRYLTIFDDVEVKVDPVKGRNYFVIPANIYENGIEYITYQAQLDSDDPVFTSVQFTPTTISKSRRLYYKQDEKPSPSNPYWYASEDRIYLLGVEQIDITKVEIGIYTTFNPIDFSNISLDDEFNFPNELVPLLIREVLSLGLFLKQIPVDIKDVKDSDLNTNKET